MTTRTRGGAIVFAAAIPLVTLVVDPAGWFPFGPTKWLVVSVLVPAGAAATLLRSPIKISRPVTVAAGALVAWLALSAAFGQDGLYAWVGTPERHLGVFTWGLCLAALVAGQNLDLERDRLALAWGGAVAAFGVGALSTSEALGWEPSVFAVTAGRLTSTMGSAAYLGAVTALLLPIAIAIAVDDEFPAPLRRVATLAVPLLSVAILGSGARAAWFGAAVAALVVAIAQRSTLARLSRRRLAVVSAALLIAVVVLIVISPVGSRLSSATSSDVGGSSRLDEWRIATRVITSHPLTGVGPEGYRIAFSEAVDDSYEQHYGRDPLPDRAHSGPLDVAAAGGIPALVAWCIAIGMMLRAALRASRSSRPWPVGVGAALIAHFAGQLLLFPTAELEPIAWLLAGVLITATTSAAPVHAPAALRRPLSATLGLVAAMSLVAGALDVVADRHAGTAASTRDPATAVRAATDAVDVRPDEVRLHLLLAQALVADDRGTAAAIAAVDDALRISPRDPIALRQRAQLLVQRATATHLPDDVSAARRAADTLVARDPHNAALLLIAGTAARLAADAPAAEAAFARAEGLSPRSAVPSIELALLYLDTGRTADARAAAARAVARDPQDQRAQEVQRRALAAG